MEKRLQTDIASADNYALQHEIDRLRLLQQIALLTATNRNSPESLPQLLLQLQAAFAVDGCGIYQRQQPDSPLELTSSIGIHEQLRRELQKVPAGRGLANEVIEKGIPHNWVDLRGESCLYCAAVLDAGWRSFLALPLIAHGRTLGVLFFFQRISRQFSHVEIDLLEQICALIGANIDAYELVEKLEWQHRLTQASQRELERSRQQLREHLQRLEVANSTLEQLSRMKDRFLALASHELRTPLTCILSAGQLLENQLQNASPDARALLSTMLQGGDRLNALVEDLLEMARIESRDIYLAHESIDLSHLLQDLLKTKKDNAGQKNLSLSRGNIPDLLAPCGDRHHLERALSHILDNAIKFTPTGGAIKLDACYVCRSEILEMKQQLEPFCPAFFASDNIPDMIDIRITDSGSGIEDKDRLEIFEKFCGCGDIRLHGRHNNLPAVPSVGLGLPLAKGLIEAHGGLLWSENRSTGQGSIFHSMLPLYRRRSQISIEGP
ncbi:MAG: GAF domain-containing sensor histidine kinase [Geopsychrobacter sp.]|nr:GAF domain-containing sensor histidine kinase [Geopsychrobacter sp.]